MKAFNGKRRPDIQWNRSTYAASSIRGMEACIVGGTAGIGRALALALAAAGAQVTVVGRTFRDQGVAGLRFLKADLTLMKDALRTAREIPAEKLDLLVFTAGIMAAPKRSETAEGIESDLAISYLNRHVMLRELAPRLGKERSPVRGKPRVFVFGFPGTNQLGNIEDFNSERSYHFMASHSNTVIGNEALVLDSAKRYPGINFYGLNPGLIRSSIRGNVVGTAGLMAGFTESLIGLLFPSAEKYAANTVPLLVSPDLERHSGAMFGRKGDAIEPSESLTDSARVHRVMELSDLLAARALGTAA